MACHTHSAYEARRLLCTEVTDTMALLNVTVHVVYVKCGVRVGRGALNEISLSVMAILTYF